MLVSDTLIVKRTRGSAGPIRLAPRSLANEIVDIGDVPEAAWRDLAAQALEPNLFYEPPWMRAVMRHARGYQGARVLLAWDGPRKKQLLGLLPVVTAWQARKLPVPMFMAWQPYVPLRTPLLDRLAPEAAAHGLLQAASAAGVEALLLPQQKIAGRAFQALQRAAAERGLPLEVWNRIERAALDATGNAETMLRESLGAKKAKELRRQRNRLADLGALSFTVATRPEDALPALEHFLCLEASGWKGKRRTALMQDEGDAAFIREAASGLSRAGQFEVLSLRVAERLVASCVVLRNGPTAFFFKLAHDEGEAKNSPGVQLTLELTRHLCADTAIVEVDSTADANHPMIDHIWRGRIALGDVFIPLTDKALRTTMIRSQIAVHGTLRDCARAIYHWLRAIREKMR